ncbi:alpha/beta fold hydrolase [Leucothrix arctica]|uniref:Alpha/beta hydrolase n=1 Tax=Leucothrix arctica TaxID=1481894 RepID=A0A317C999_9GAMM|nr:alpha/beta hydrolase [Leucothrix arctica]PWQ95275.1 alpha/beta hydrolase [Leucothrix arctica]
MPHKVTQPATAYSTKFHLGLGFHGFHRIHYIEWGKASKFNTQETLLCVHGITRNARDFDYLAKKMCKDYRVVCPDVVGRGDSDHLGTDEGYNYLQYNSDMNALIARLGVTEVNWIGTSMGGIIGMVLASLPQSPIRRLVINDIGPEVARDTLLSLSENMEPKEDFDTLEDVEAYFRVIYEEFAPMTDVDWKHLTKHSCRRTSKGKWRLKTDKCVGEAFRKSITYLNVDMWEAWDQISCPVLILRGKDSSFLTEEVAQRMISTGPETTLVEFENTGHTPTLRNDEQVNVIADWLKST